MILAVSKKSIHYQYYLVLNRLWGYNGREPKSLCTYTQFLFWITIGTVFISPFMLLGWLLLKFGRMFYKVCSWTEPGQKVIDFMDNIFNISEDLTKTSNKMEDSPIESLLGFLGNSFIKLSLTLACIFIPICVLMFIKPIAIFIASVFMLIGFIIFNVLSGLGWLLKAVLYNGFVKFVVLPIITHFALIGNIVMISLIVILLAFVIISVLSHSKKFKEFLAFKLNGFQKAKEENAKRREKLAKELEKKREADRLISKAVRKAKEAGEIPYSLSEKVGMWFSKRMKSLKDKFVSKEVDVKGKKFKKVMSLGVIWHTIVSLYRGVCPLVKVIDEDQDPDNEPKFPQKIKGSSYGGFTYND